MAARKSFTLLHVKQALRSGKYAWPGGYPTYFVTSDGGALSHESVRENWREIVASMMDGDIRSGWHIHGLDINWENAFLCCDHSGQPIESAYDGED